MQTLTSVLADRPYPGRGVLLARADDGALGVVYFLTGRSEGSRRRALAVRAGGDVAVEDTSSGPHDALRHYVAVARRGTWLVVGNGDQVVPLAESLSSGESVAQAWGAHTFEPYPPIFTTRVWVALDASSDADGVVGAAKRSGRSLDSGDASTDHLAWTAGHVAPGTGVLMTTYDGSTSEVRSTAAPVDVAAPAATLEALLDQVWDGLDPALRVAALAVDAGSPAAPPLLRA